MPINDSFTFDGKNSADFGLLMASDPEAIHPARRGESSQIVGRNGVFVREDGSYDTYMQTYDVMLDSQSDGVYARSRAIANWLLGSRGFCRLEDTFEPDVFKLARYAKQLSVENRLTRFGRSKIALEVQPQRYLKVGETEISVESSVDSGGLYIGAITMQGIPYGAKAFYTDSLGGTALFVGEYEDANGNIIAQFYDTPVAVPDGAVNARLVWNNAQADTMLLIGMVDEDGNRTILCGVTGTSPTVFNPTDYEARPLLKFVDTSEEPTPVAQTITAVNDTYIDGSGEISNWKPAWSGQTGEGYKTCTPVSVSGYSYAYISGNSYAFYDSNGNVITFVSGTSKTRYSNTQIIIPSGANTIAIGTLDGMPDLALSLKAARPNPGASAVTINGTTISLDFSVHDTIYLDCDLHDAHYIDGSSANDKVTFTSNIDPYPTFPGFVPGENTVIVRDGDNLDFSVVPRWWEL